MKRKLYSATPLDSNRPFLCKQECSLLKVYAFDGKRFHSRSCGSFHFPTLMFCCQSFQRKNICSNRFSGKFVHLRGTFSPQSHMLLACWCHHLKKLREKHETWKLIIAFLNANINFYRKLFSRDNNVRCHIASDNAWHVEAWATFQCTSDANSRFLIDHLLDKRDKLIWIMDWIVG